MGKGSSMMNKTISEMRFKLEQEDDAKGVKVRLKCGACMYLTGKCPKLEAPCIELGKTATSNNCKHFVPNYSHIRNSEPELITDIGKMIRNLPERIKHLIAYAIINSTSMERVTEHIIGSPIKLGQPLMVNMSAPRVDFLNCWFSAYAMGITKDKRGIILLSRLMNTDKWAHAIMMLNSETIMTLTEWKNHKKKLIKSKRINAPASNLNSLMPFVSKETVKSNFEEYKAPDMAEIQISKTDMSKPKLKRTFKVEVDAAGNKVVTI